MRRVINTEAALTVSASQVAALAHAALVTNLSAVSGFPKKASRVLEPSAAK